MFLPIFFVSLSVFVCVTKVLYLFQWVEGRLSRLSIILSFFWHHIIFPSFFNTDQSYLISHLHDWLPITFINMLNIVWHQKSYLYAKSQNTFVALQTLSQILVYVRKDLLATNLLKYPKAFERNTANMYIQSVYLET